MEGAAKRIGRRTRRSVELASARDRIRISPASIFEITALCAAGRLKLARPIEQWVYEALDTNGLRVAELSVAVALDAGQITRAELADPMDRLLVATARLLDATFATSDVAILKYAADSNHVRVMNAAA